MGVAEGWARTAEQIDLMQAARLDDAACSWCGRRLGEHETVYVERFLVGDLKQNKILKSMRRFAEEVMPAFRD